jgi:hypothetical protein
MNTRRPPQLRWKKVTVTPEEAKELLSRPACAWTGCSNACQGDLPPDWVYIVTWWWPQPTLRTIKEIVTGPTCTRDAVLCGQHARELESLLKPIRPDARLETPAGEA